ncbi:MAG TPA: sigma-70 family RNA polymerase sigma factor [Saprospiraceae bacterium]|nr:sigma-70 family RNA polymerase sigma factor [Saprospiraceae bacterium]MCO5276934.1 sigma-70 family RNA polymerase sigma factor [Saprospiraceae bacterium]HQU96841.1 sigma-70 family RNA polymerase sigma factor [Saprospiraceae bacterium]HRG44021.1 sigma-70 family RNA polymerase sigma factor [Saprospiraceae bacterium]
MDIDNILQGCLNGQQKSQELLVRTFAPKLLAICERYCKDKEMAKDALQETFINIFKYLHTYNGDSEFITWSRKVAVNNCLRINNKYFKLHFVEEAEARFADHSYIPEAYSNLTVDEIMKLVKKLPDSQYIVFNMFVVEGFSHREIGEELNITESSSRSTLTRARMRLIEMIQKLEDRNNNSLFNSKIAFL